MKVSWYLQPSWKNIFIFIFLSLHFHTVILLSFEWRELEYYVNFFHFYTIKDKA